RPGRGRGEVRAELDRASGAGRGELDNDGRRDVQPPPEPAVELRRAVEVPDWDNDHLELHVHDAGLLSLDVEGPCRCFSPRYQRAGLEPPPSPLSCRDARGPGAPVPGIG